MGTWSGSARGAGAGVEPIAQDSFDMLQGYEGER